MGLEPKLGLDRTCRSWVTSKSSTDCSLESKSLTPHLLDRIDPFATIEGNLIWAWLYHFSFSTVGFKTGLTRINPPVFSSNAAAAAFSFGPLAPSKKPEKPLLFLLPWPADHRSRGRIESHRSSSLPLLLPWQNHLVLLLDSIAAEEPPSLSFYSYPSYSF